MVSFKVIVVIFALLIGSFVVDAQKFASRCGRHEHFERCAKPISCQRSCKPFGGKICSTVCTPTCICNGGRVRNHMNRCVKLSECRSHRNF